MASSPEVRSTTALSRVVTVTPAPAIDRVIRLDALTRGLVNRSAPAEHFLGGNGLNLARALAAAGNPTAAVAPLNIAPEFAAQPPGAHLRPIPIRERTRVNSVIIERDGTTTNVNEPAARLSAGEWAALHRELDSAVRDIDADWLVVGGAMPATDGADAAPAEVRPFAELAERTGARLALDLPAATLGDWLAQGVRPHLIAPNIEELRELTGRRIPTIGAAVDAAFALLRSGVEHVFATLGHRGVLLVSRTAQHWARTAPVRPVNTTGAGDATLAGLLHGWRGDGDPDAVRAALATAVRFGRAAVLTASPTINPEVIPSVPVEIGEPVPTARLD